MLYKLRNNAFVSAEKEKGTSVFVSFRKASLPGVAYAEVLSRTPQELHTIVDKLGASDTVPVEDMLKILEDYGFVISGKTEEELVKKEIPLYRDITIE